MANKEEVQAFLDSIDACTDIIFVDRTKNRTTDSILGLTTNDKKDIIKNLLKDDYYKGPENDYDSRREGKLWMFKIKIDYQFVYIN